MQFKISVDAMGGDHGLRESVPACVRIVDNLPELELILVGREVEINAELHKLGAAEHPRLSIHNATQVVEMDESPAFALRNKEDSSMWRSIELHRDGIASASVSAGNTGALMAISRYVLRTFPGIDRPAICAQLPGIKGNSHVLDLGANVDSRSEQLLQFAIMGSELVASTENIPFPTVGLLNVGSEDIKGSDRVKQASALLSTSDLNFVGYVEGNSLFSGEIDVIVCDGFVGNAMLKASEGIADLIHHDLVKGFQRNLYTRMAGFLAKPVLRSVRQRLSPENNNGASLLGLRGVVIKSHGSARQNSFAVAIHKALLEVKKGTVERVANRLEKLLKDNPTLS
ncbi:MAG: phosphate acyltransferase PlsX [Candidatus Eutrophobiaceae bacterium]